MPINNLSLADTYGRGVADRQAKEMNALRIDQGQQNLAQNREAFTIEKQQFNDDQRLANTRRLLAGIRTVKQNPAALPQLAEQLANEGILNAQAIPQLLQSAQTNPEQFMRGMEDLEASLMVAVGDEPQQLGKSDLVAVQGESGPQYVTAQDAVGKQPFSGGASSDVPSNVREYQYYQTLSPEEQEEYRRVKRGEPKPSSTLEKRLFDVNDKAFKARTNVSRYNDIANRMEQINPASGIQAKWTEKYKELTGSEDAVTLLRKDWNNLRVSAAVQNLPPGVASDKDIELVMSAFLPENASPEAVASFMRGLAKLEEIKADYHEFESDYLSKNGTAVGLSQAWREALQQVAPQQQDNVAPEGTVITNAQGQRFIKQGGQWVRQ